MKVKLKLCYNNNNNNNNNNKSLMYCINRAIHCAFISSKTVLSFTELMGALIKNHSIQY